MEAPSWCFWFCPPGEQTIFYDGFARRLCASARLNRPGLRRVDPSPVEQLLGLRMVPNLLVVRPVSAVEASKAWKVGLARAHSHVNQLGAPWSHCRTSPTQREAWREALMCFGSPDPCATSFWSPRESGSEMHWLPRSLWWQRVFRPPSFQRHGSNCSPTTGDV